MLQNHFSGKTRSHKNDLVSLEYMYGNVGQSHDVLRGDTVFDSLIRYTFFWTFEYADWYNYVHPDFRCIYKPTKREDGMPLIGCFFDATLKTWIEYCDLNQVPNFVKVIKEKLIEDGYELRFGRK